MRAWRYFLLFMEQVFFVHMLDLIFWSHLTYLILKNDFLILEMILITWIQRHKVK